MPKMGTIFLIFLMTAGTVYVLNRPQIKGYGMGYL